jgi:hypothetical protein
VFAASNIKAIALMTDRPEDSHLQNENVLARFS